MYFIRRNEQGDHDGAPFTATEIEDTEGAYDRRARQIIYLVIPLSARKQKVVEWVIEPNTHTRSLAQMR